jgi:hypothetical protein
MVKERTRANGAGPGRVRVRAVADLRQGALRGAPAAEAGEKSASQRAGLVAQAAARLRSTLKRPVGGRLSAGSSPRSRPHFEALKETCILKLFLI